MQIDFDFFTYCKQRDEEPSSMVWKIYFNLFAKIIFANRSCKFLFFFIFWNQTPPEESAPAHKRPNIKKPQSLYKKVDLS